MRLDRYLVENGYFTSRNKAQEAINQGKVKVDGKLAKASFSVIGTEDICVIKEQNEFVSRGGKKLSKALDFFSLTVEGFRALDIGASTGGFTDCLLKRGAAKVVAVDVGENQLVSTLKADPRVTSLEKTNIKTLTPESVGSFDLITIDVSFISLTCFLDRLPLFLNLGAQIIALIKPQFEAGPSNIGKKGIVKDPKVHLQVLEKVILKAETVGLYTKGITYSPITGGSGNIEFLACWGLEKKERPTNEELSLVVNTAHKQVIES